TMASGDLTDALINGVFGISKGGHGVGGGAQPMTAVVFTVDDITDPPYDPARPHLAMIKTQLTQQIVTDLLSTYAAQLQSQTDVRINQAAIASALGISTTQ